MSRSHVAARATMAAVRVSLVTSLGASLALCAGAQGPAGAEPAKEPARDEPAHFEPVDSRWYAPGYSPEWLDLTGYEINEPGGRWWNPYRQNALKGDFPVFGSEEVFLNVTGLLRQFVEVKEVPTPTLNTGSGGASFFGDGDQEVFLTQMAITFDLFEAPQAFEPVKWRLKVTPVFQRTVVTVEEQGVLFADPSSGDRRADDELALQEALFEYHVTDLSNRYDFLSTEVGILPFRSDFRGFVFDDTNLGARVSGNADANRWQYNLLGFDMLDKHTNSGLNKFDDREQEVLIANLYRQDWPVNGFTSSVSFHYNHDHRGTEFDDNGVLVSPAPVGLAQENEVTSYYLGAAGEGHLGRVNVTTAFYQALGRDSRNPFAGRRVDIDAQLAAMELSYDFDWYRVRGFGMWASGDDDTRDDVGEGFDAILDAPNFAGGGLSFFNSQALRVLGVNLTNAGSFLPDLQSSQTEGHSNFVNPGLTLLGGALDFELTPKWRATTGTSWLVFEETDTLEVYLQLPDVEREIGTELFMGTQYRPFLNNHLILLLGGSALLPGDGFARVFQSDDTVFTASTNIILSF